MAAREAGGNVKLNHLNHVSAVAALGSLRAAGRHLGVAQPAITRSIRELEHELGVPLFERHAKGVRLTPMGAAFAQRADAIQLEIQRARDEIEQMKGKSTGHVSIALSTASIISLMPRALELFRQSYPNAVVNISESLFQSVETDIARGKIDFYVGPVDNSSKSKLAVDKLFDNNRVVVSRKNHPLANATNLSEIADAHWVDATLSTSNSPIFNREGDDKMSFPQHELPKAKIVIHAKSALIAILAVANSDLLASMPQQWLENPAIAGQIEALPDIQPLAAPPICMARRSDLPLTPMAENLYDIMQKVGKNYAERLSRGAF